MRRSSRKKSPSAAPARLLPQPTGTSPTERRNPRSQDLDQLSPSAGVALMLREEARVPRVLMRWQREIGQVVNHVTRAFRSGGRLFYVGAGTSGRLGVLDASECPPTFRTAPRMVQGIIAGGEIALRRAVEGAEDDWAAGAEALRRHRVNRKDVILGIAASGTTRFVWGTLHQARRQGAKTILLCFNPHLRFSKSGKPSLVIAPDLGPEVLTGSTRLKAGTATKLVLNAITTLAMVRLGKVASNLMVDLLPTNEKLRRRAIGIVRELTGADAATAQRALERSGWVIRKAASRLSRK